MVAMVRFMVPIIWNVYGSYGFTGLKCSWL